MTHPYPDTRPEVRVVRRTKILYVEEEEDKHGDSHRDVNAEEQLVGALTHWPDSRCEDDAHGHGREHAGSPSTLRELGREAVALEPAVGCRVDDSLQCRHSRDPSVKEVT